MTLDRSVDERIGAWLVEEAPSQLPDRVLQATFERTRVGRQRWGPIRLTSLPVPHFAPATVAFGSAALVLVVGLVLLYPTNSPINGGLGPAPSATPSSPPTARPTLVPSLAPISLVGQIAFERTVDGNTDIYLMNADRTGLRRLTNDTGADLSPSWSPDGRHIVFRRVVDSGSDLYVMNRDGSDPRRLTDSPGSERDSRFSPDGRTIAYWGGSDGASDLRLIGQDGSNDRLVVRLEDTVADGIGWTADGGAILFNRGIASGGKVDIMRIDLGSKALRRITESPEDDGTFALSNDGSTIAFQSDRLPAGIYLMDVDGSNIRHLAGSQNTGDPVSWSPDGGHLVYSQPDGWLYLVPTDRTEVTRWTEGGPRVAWRP